MLPKIRPDRRLTFSSLVSLSLTSVKMVCGRNAIGIPVLVALDILKLPSHRKTLNLSSLQIDQLNEFINLSPKLGVIVAIVSVVSVVLTTWIAIWRQWFAYRGQSLVHRSKRQDALLKTLKTEGVDEINSLRLQLLVDRACGITLEAELLRFILTRNDPAILLYHLRRGRRHVELNKSQNRFCDLHPLRRISLATIENVFSFLTVTCGVVTVLSLILLSLSGGNLGSGVLVIILLPLAWTFMENDLAAYSARYLIEHSPFSELPTAERKQRKKARREKDKVVESASPSIEGGSK